MWRSHIETWRAPRRRRRARGGVRPIPPGADGAAPSGHACCCSAGVAHAEPLRVVASTPELGSLVREVGGDRVSVTVLAKPSEDPHFVEAKPSFVKELNQADLYVSNGLDLEMGYQPVLLTGARNARILPGQPGLRRCVGGDHPDRRAAGPGQPLDGRRPPVRQPALPASIRCSG